MALSPLGALFVIDGENTRILKINAANDIERTFGDIGGGKGALHSPTRIRVNDNNIVFVQDGNIIVAYDVFGNYIYTVGREVFTRLITFTIHHDTLFALDSSHVRIVDAHGTFVRDIDLSSALSGKHKVADVVDIDIYNDTLFMLFRDEVLSWELHSESGNH